MANREYYLANREACLARAKARYEAKKEEIRAYKRQWQQDNKAAIAAKKKAYAEANKDAISSWHKQNYAANTDEIKARTAAYRKAHPEKSRAAVAAWVEKNRARYREVKRAYARKRPELGREKIARRRARMRSAGVERVDYNDVLLASGGMCGICGDPLGDTVHFDHIIPVAKGGPHVRSNLQAAHPHCNIRKSDKMPGEAPPWQ